VNQRQGVSAIVGGLVIVIGIALALIPAPLSTACYGDSGEVQDQGISQCASAAHLQTVGAVVCLVGIVVVLGALLFWRRSVLAARQ
jgi:hypothetical protein